MHAIENLEKIEYKEEIHYNLKKKIHYRQQEEKITR